jgi:uncharacterized protein (DUF58 family)
VERRFFQPANANSYSLATILLLLLLLVLTLDFDSSRTIVVDELCKFRCRAGEPSTAVVAVSTIDSGKIDSGRSIYPTDVAMTRASVATDLIMIALLFLAVLTCN